MTKDLLKIKRIFVLIQVIILLISLLIFAAVLANRYAQNAGEEIKTDMNNVVNLMVDKINRTQSAPEEISGRYVLFILDQKDGSYISERNDESLEDRSLWEQHRLKLTYQMQKQKRGWISYPQQKRLGELFESNKLIRYSTDDELGLIVIAETIAPSKWSLLREFIDRKNMADFLLIVVIGFVIINLVTNTYFARIEAIMTDSYSGNLLDFNQAVVKNDPLESIGKKKKVKKKPIKIDLNRISEGEAAETQPQSIPMDSSVGVKLDEKTYESPVREGKNEPLLDESLQLPETFVSEKKIPEAPVTPKREGAETFKPDDSPNEWAVSIQGIKSPVLKKLIKEMRAKKENV